MGTEQDIFNILGLESGEQESYGVLQLYDEGDDYKNEISTYEPGEHISQWSDFIDKSISANQSPLGFNLDPKFVKRIIEQESGGDPYIESYAGATGLMQLMPETAESLGVVDPVNPEENIQGGVKLLSQLMDKYDGDKRKVLAAYNGGEKGVDQAVEAYGDKWLSHLDEFKGIDSYTGRNHAEQTWAYIDSIERDIPMGPVRSAMEDIEDILGFEDEPVETPVEEDVEQITQKPLTGSSGDIPEYKEPGLQPLKSLVEGAKQTIKNIGGFAKGLFETDAASYAKEKEEWLKLAAGARARGNEKLAQSHEEHAKTLDKFIAGHEKVAMVSENIIKSDILSPDESFEKAEGIKGFVQDVIMMAPQIASQIGVTAAGGAPAGIAFMGTQIAGGKYEQLTSEGVEPERALQASLADAALQAPLEQIGIGKAMKLWQPGRVATAAVKEILETGAVEFLTEALQKYPEAVTEIWGKGKGKPINDQVDEFVNNFWQITKDGIYEGLVAAPFAFLTAGAGVATQKYKAAPKKAAAPKPGVEKQGGVFLKGKKAVSKMSKEDFFKYHAEKANEYLKAEKELELSNKYGTDEQKIAAKKKVEKLDEELMSGLPEAAWEMYKSKEKTTEFLPGGEERIQKTVEEYRETELAGGIKKPETVKMLPEDTKIESERVKEGEGMEAFRPKKRGYEDYTKKEIQEEHTNLLRESERAELSFEETRTKLDTELEEVQFASELRSGVLTEEVTRISKKGKVYKTSVLKSELSKSDWESLTGESTAARSDETNAKLQGIADAYNQAKKEGAGTTFADVPPEKILNSVDNWAPDDVANLLAKGMNKKDFGNFKTKWKNLSEKAAEEQELAFEDIGKRGEAIEARINQLHKEVIKTAGNVDDFVENFSAPVGFSIKDISGVKQVNDDVKMPGSVNPEAEARFKAAHGIPKPKVRQRLLSAARGVQKAFTRHFPKLDSKTDGALIDILRQHESVSEYSKIAATNVIRGVTAGMGPRKMDIFERNLIYPDILRDVKNGLYEGKKLPFGYKNKVEIETDYKEYQKILNENPDIKDAIEVRNKFMRTFRQNLVDNKLLPEEVLKDDNYFHHQVLEHMAMKDFQGTGTTAGDVRTHRKGWQRSRIGADKDFNTNYLEAEYEVISQGIAQLETAKTLRRIKETADITDQLKADAKKINSEKGVKMIEGGEAGKVDYKELIPEGYTLWQPKEGNVFYQANSLADKVVQDVLEGSARIQRIAGEKQVNIEKLRLLKESDIKKALAIGGKKEQWVIPTRLAETMDSFRKPATDNIIGKFSKNAMSTWKQWTLLNPFRVVKYNVNNMSGDMDIALAYNPRILKESWRAGKELANYNLAGKAPSQEILTAIRKGVIGSGFTGKEITDISESGFFKAITGKDPNLVQKYWGGVKNFTEYRENILRLAAYRHFKSELAKGKNLYGASKKAEVDKVSDIDDKAAKLARELIGDYGNISQAGMWLREHMMPFYSWMEINSPRYLKLVQNLKHEGQGEGRGKRIAGAALKRSATLTGKATWKAGKLTAKAAALSALVTLWNHTFFPDEEKELGKARRQLHLILGRNKDTGEIRSVRFQGALSDVLNWVGAEDLHFDIGDIITGKSTIAKKGKEAAGAFAGKIFNALGPQFKLPVETVAGKSTYPDITRPRTIRSKGEHIAKTFSVQLPYKIFTGKPIRGIKDELMASIVYKTDPGEQAYFDTKALVHDYLRDQGKDVGSYSPSNKSNALYYYKKALAYKDDKAADKWWKRYEELGGNKRGKRKSVQSSSPLGSLNRRQWGKFKDSLDENELGILEKAEKWYKKIYK